MKDYYFFKRCKFRLREAKINLEKTSIVLLKSKQPKLCSWILELIILRYLLDTCHTNISLWKLIV